MSKGRLPERWHVVIRSVGGETWTEYIIKEEEPRRITCQQYYTIKPKSNSPLIDFF